MATKHTRGDKMKTYINYDDIPFGAAYLGSELGDGSMEEWLDDVIAFAINPVKLRMDDNNFAYFDLGE
jgi:hypothetical protein